MSQSIYLLLEVPSEHASGMSGPPGSQADLQRLLARSRLRLVSRNAGQLQPPETATQAPVPMPQEQGDAGEAVKSLEEGQADLQRLLARSRLRLVSRNAGQLPPPETATQAPVPMPQEQGDAGEAVKSLEEVERDYIVEILSRSGGNRSKAARMLNISRRTLQRKMARFG
ncbi:MAG: helix-turn-helix domain-containing protein [Dechloromonas sp.]|nr:helix-turn-helix domain-containing protein [Dechloromonas sp.]